MEVLVTAGLIATGLGLLAWPALYRAEVWRKRRRDPRFTSPHLMGVFDEVFYPSAYYAAQIVETETRAPAPAPLPGGPSHVPAPQRR